MSKEQVLQYLEEHRSDCVSGEDLAQRLGLTRASIWKMVRSLREDGFSIRSKPGSGYYLEESTDRMLADRIIPLLQTTWMGHPIRLYDTVDSTNLELRRLAGEGAPEGLVVIAEKQTAGRGRMGRSFHSPPRNGIYMSLLLRPQLPFNRVHFITMLAAVCVAEAVQLETGLCPQIKWVNDLFLDGKKLCGILSEATVEGETGLLSAVVVGIGINVGSTKDFPALSGNRPGSLGDYTSKPVSRCALVANILNAFERYYSAYLQTQNPSPFLQPYREALCLLGQAVMVTRGNESFSATVLGLSDEGGLIVRNQAGQVQELLSGEVSVHSVTPSAGMA